MKFRTLIRHKPGTALEFKTGTIVLKPDEPFDGQGAGFATFSTEDEAIIDRLLEIPEGFALIGEVPPAVGAIEVVAVGDARIGQLEVAQAAQKTEAPAKASTEPDAKADKAAESPAQAPAFVLTDSDSGATLDLAAMDDAALKAFVKEHGIKGVHHKLTGDKLRAAIVAATAA